MWYALRGQQWREDWWQSRLRRTWSPAFWNWEENAQWLSMRLLKSKLQWIESFSASFWTAVRPVLELTTYTCTSLNVKPSSELYYQRWSFFTGETKFFRRLVTMARSSMSFMWTASNDIWRTIIRGLSSTAAASRDRAGSSPPPSSKIQIRNPSWWRRRYLVQFFHSSTTLTSTKLSKRSTLVPSHSLFTCLASPVQT